MSAHKLLGEIQNFKKDLKEYRQLTEGEVEKWDHTTELKKKLATSEDDERIYAEIKSRLNQKLALFGRDLSDEVTIVTSSSEGKVIRKRNGLHSLLTIADTLKEERLKIQGLGVFERSRYKKVWTLVMTGIERYTGGLMYFDERKDDLKKRELEVKKKEDELRIKDDEVESLKKIYAELVNIKRGLPELIRSEITREIKKTHREIEKHTNPNTKSQQKVSD